MSTSGKGKGDQTEKQTPNYGNKRGVRRGHGSEPPRPALTRPAAAAPEPVRDSRPDAHTARPVSAPLPADATVTVVPPSSPQRESAITPVSCSKHPRVPSGLGRGPLCAFSGTLVPRVLRWWPRVCPLGRLVDPSLCVLVSTRKAPFVSYLYIIFYLKKRILWLKKNNLKTASG